MSETSGKARHLNSRLPNRLCGDEELARRLSGGDSAALDEVFRRYHQSIYRFCSAMVGGEEAKDVLQNVMTKLVTSMPDDKDFRLKPWLYRVARNECVDQIRSLRRCDNGLEVDTVADQSGFREPQRAAESRERLERLVEDLTELPGNQRAALVMRELSGLGYAEIADSVGSSEAGAKQLVYEARLALAQMELGRNLDCAEVRQTISTLDRRRLKERRVRSHLRTCPGCKDFERSITTREAGFRSLYPPLPMGIAMGILGGAREGASALGMTGSGGVGLASGGVAAGGLVSTGLVSKGLLAVVLAGGIGVGSSELAKHRDPERSGPDPVVRNADAGPVTHPGTPSDEASSGKRGGRVRRQWSQKGGQQRRGAFKNPGSQPVEPDRDSRPARTASEQTAGSGMDDGSAKAPGHGSNRGSSGQPATPAAGQARAAETSSAKPGKTGNPAPSRKPPAPPGQSSNRGQSGPGATPGVDGSSGHRGVARVVGRPEKQAG